jgi:hypothetical protein
VAFAFRKCESRFDSCLKPSAEKVFEDMEVKTGEMDAALENVYSASID